MKWHREAEKHRSQAEKLAAQATLPSPQN
jgi:hypothetical protein